VSRSATMTASARANQRPRPSALGIGTRLSRPVQVAVAPGAEGRAIHVRPVMPAALALGMLARGDLHRRARAALQTRRRGQQQVLQMLAEACQQLVVGAV